MTIPKRTIGGLEVSAVGLGCMGMSQAYGIPDDTESLATLHRALDLGCSFWDTSDAYGPHANERLLGQVLATRRDDVVLATKFGLASPPEADGSRRVPRCDAAYVAEACDGSLERLGVDVIDLYYCHRADPLVPIEETVGAMAELVVAGKVRYLGLSECQPDTLRRAAAVHPIAALQSEWSLWTRDLEDEIVGVCRELGIGLVPFSPLGRGALTGTLPADGAFGPGDFRAGMERYQGENLAKNLATVEALKALASDLGCTPGQLAIAWVLAQGDDVVPIPGTKKVSRLEENLGACGVTLGDAELARLAELFPGDAIAGTRFPFNRAVASGFTPPLQS